MYGFSTKTMKADHFTSSMVHVRLQDKRAGGGGGGGGGGELGDAVLTRRQES